MKINTFSITIICLICIFGATGCEKTDLQKSLPNDDGKIMPRTDCASCPNLTDCCCFILLQNTSGSANLTLCGTTDGTGNCTGNAVGSCDSFSGGGQSMILNSSNPRQGFCMDPGEPFYVTNNGIGGAAIYISCQGDQPNPQIITITIPGNSTVYFGSNGTCEIEECD